MRGVVGAASVVRKRQTGKRRSRLRQYGKGGIAIVARILERSAVGAGLIQNVGGTVTVEVADDDAGRRPDNREPRTRLRRERATVVAEIAAGRSVDRSPDIGVAVAIEIRGIIGTARIVRQRQTGKRRRRLRQNGETAVAIVARVLERRTVGARLVQNIGVAVAVEVADEDAGGSARSRKPRARSARKADRQQAFVTRNRRICERHGRGDRAGRGYQRPVAAEIGAAGLVG